MENMDCLESLEYGRLINDPKTFAAFDKAHYVSIVSNASEQSTDSDVKFQCGTFQTEGEMVAWVNSQAESESLDPQSTVNANARLIIIAFPKEIQNLYLPLPLSRQAFELISGKFDLAPSFLQVLETRLGINLCRPMTPGLESWESARIVVQEFWTDISLSTALSYKAYSQTTYALVFGVTPFLIPNLFQHLEDTREMVEVPLTLPTLIAHCSTFRSQDQIETAYRSLTEIEKSTGSRMIFENNKMPLDLKSLDLVDITRRLYSVSIRLSFEIQACKANLSLLAFLAKITTSFKPRTTVNQEDNIVTLQRNLLAKISHLREWNEGIETRATYLMRRAHDQSQTVYSLTAQRDNLLNIGLTEASRSLAELSRQDNIAMKAIAEDSKIVALANARDSAAMRVIAAVTILFLPATFTATLFSTSFFDFQPSDRSQVVSQWIWLYCVVTVLLTLLIQSGWYITSRRKEKEIVSRVFRRYSREFNQDLSEEESALEACSLRSSHHDFD